LHYSQAKIEIYGLWCALQAYQLYIIGVKNLQVEINASYIKRMLNNPDIQPGTLVSRWIIGIKLFQLELTYVPGHLHMGLDGLSHHAASPNNPIKEDDTDDWFYELCHHPDESLPSWDSKLNYSYCLN